MKDGINEILQTESLCTKIFRSSSIGIYVFRISDGHFLIVNDAFLNIIGYSREEVEGHSDAELDLFVDKEQGDAWMKILDQGGNIYNNDSMIRHKSGEVRHVITSLEPCMISGEKIGIVIVNDITARKKTEDKLSESEEKFRSLFMASIDGILLTSPDGKILEANPAACKMFRRSEDEIKRLGRYGLVSKDDPRVLSLLEERERTGRARGELFFLRADGSKFPAELTSSIFFTPQGDKRTSMIIRDITEKKATEEAQNIAEEKYFKIFESSPDLIMLTYFEDGRIVATNDKIESLTGFKSSEVIGRLTTEIKFWADPFQRNLLIARLKKEGRVRNMEAKIRNRTGELRDTMISAETIYFPDGKHIISIFRDITELKKAEEKSRLTFEMFSKAFKQGPAARTITRVSDGKFVEVNDSFLRLFGFARSEVIGHTSTGLKMWSLEDRAGIIKKQIKSGGLTNHQLIAKTKSGKPLYLLFSSRPVEILGELCYITTMIDITGLKKAERELKESEGRLRLATEQANVAVWEYSYVTNTMSRSRNHDRLYGLKRQPIWEFNTFLNATHPDDREYSKKIITESVSPGGPNNYRFDFRVVYPDGQVHWLEVTGRVIKRNEIGEGIIVRGTLTDITKRINYEKTLEKSKQEIRDLATHIDSVRENERKAIALNLHDDLGQKLTAVRIDLNQLKSGLMPSDNNSVNRIDGMIKLLDETIGTIQKVSSELWPSILYNLGLKDAVEWKFKEFSNSTGIRHTIRFYPKDFLINQNLSVLVFRILQESLTNVARHAGATTVRFNLKISDSSVQCTIKDNGKGIDEDSLKNSNSFGLIGMRERAAAVNGQVLIKGVPGMGTTVTLRIPIARESDVSGDVK